MVAPAPVIAGQAPAPLSRPRQAPLRGKLPLMIEREHWSRRLLVAVVVVAILVGFWAFTQQFWTPAHPGTDQNGYLVGGKMLADHFSRALTPDDPYSFVGRMWISAGDGRYVPKYPPGFSTIVAMVLTFGGPTAVYFINPFCMTLALAGVFMIVRQVAGSFAGILGMLIVASSPVALSLANNPNSHASALCFVTWGMYLLLRWWERGAFWRAALAGCLLGIAATVRYTEALLGIPAILVALFNLHWRRGKSWAQAGTLIGCWAGPLLLVLSCNKLSMGSWTGYDSTNESTAGFKWEYFEAHWEMMIRQFANTGLFFTLPIGLMGLILLLARNWRLSLVMWAWLLPSVLAYTAYYWYWPADQLGIGSMRFLLTIFPPVALGAVWCMTRLVPAAPYSSWTLRWVVAPLAALVVVVGAGAYNVWGALPMLNGDYRKCLAVAQAADKVIHDAKAPPNSVIFGPREMLHHLQFAGPYRLYDTDELSADHILSLNKIDPDEPNGLQPRRAKALYDLIRADQKDDREFAKQLPNSLAKIVRQLAMTALADHRRVFVIIAADAGPPLKFTDPAYEKADQLRFSTTKILSWIEPVIPLSSSREWRKNSPAWQDGQAANWQLVEVMPAEK